MGEGLANRIRRRHQEDRRKHPRAAWNKTYVTGPSALIADTHIAGDRSLQS